MMTPISEPQVDDLQLLLNIVPQRLSSYLNASPKLAHLIEIVMDLGRPPEVRFSNMVHRLKDLGDITPEDLAHSVNEIGDLNTDNRAGIERTLHRISAIKNRKGCVIGLTCRVGRAVEGTVEIIRDIIESGQNCLFLGPPGIGKTTILRETARILAEHKRVVVVDTSNEIAGDGDISHPGIGDARRMQVPSPDRQHAVMIEAVENHMPEVIVVDEIGTEQETRAARTIAERGVQLVATAHGYDLNNLIKNPALSNLIGGVQTVIIGDEEAKFRGTSKSVLERKSSPTFDVVIEIKSREVFAVYNPVAAHVDGLLRDDRLEPEMRTRQDDGDVDIKQGNVEEILDEREQMSAETIRIFPFGVSMTALSSAIHALNVPAVIARDIAGADMVVSLKSKVGNNSKISQILKGRQLPLHVVKTPSEIPKFLRHVFNLTESDEESEEEGRREAERACKIAIDESRVMELSPRDKLLRRIQHRISFENGLNSMSVGEDPTRRVRIFPRGE
jgi:stage III sporulation protein SpoIIIAA